LLCLGLSALAHFGLVRSRAHAAAHNEQLEGSNNYFKVRLCDAQCFREVAGAGARELASRLGRT
jgi:hypothetical protein